MPINLDFIRIVPYVKGRWSAGPTSRRATPSDRTWGGAVRRAPEITAWKAYPGVESELLNVHGINHKIDFEADYRDAFSNVNLNRSACRTTSTTTPTNTSAATSP